MGVVGDPTLAMTLYIYDQNSGESEHRQSMSRNYFLFLLLFLKIAVYFCFLCIRHFNWTHTLPSVHWPGSREHCAVLCSDTSLLSDSV